jgi:hypothetical protein
LAEAPNECIQHHIAWYLLGVLASSTSSLSGFGLDEKINEEEDWKKSSESDGKVSAELNLKSNSVGRQCLNNGVKGESWAHKSSNWDGSSGNLGDLLD